MLCSPVLSWREREETRRERVRKGIKWGKREGDAE